MVLKGLLRHLFCRIRRIVPLLRRTCQLDILIDVDSRLTVPTGYNKILPDYPGTRFYTGKYDTKDDTPQQSEL